MTNEIFMLNMTGLAGQVIPNNPI